MKIKKHRHKLVACLHEADLIKANNDFSLAMNEYKKKLEANPGWDKFYIKGPRTVLVEPMWWVCKNCDKILKTPTGLKSIKVFKSETDDKSICTPK